MVKIARVLVVGMLVAAASVTLRAEILEQIIVKVNGDIVTKTDFEQRQVNALRAKNLQPQGAAPDQLKAAIAEVTPSLIVDAVDELLLLQRGKDLKYSLSDEQFKQIVDQIRKENKLEDEQAFQAALKSEGMTMADLRRNLEKNMIISRVQGTEVMGKVGISEEEARKYHDEHIADFTKPGTVTLREIFVAVPSDPKGLNAGIDEQTKEIVAGIRKRALAGESFEKLATETSTAPSKSNGGLIGPMNEAELAPALRDLLGKMKVGDISEILRTPKGYQILKLEARTGDTVLTAEEAHDQIAEKLFEQKRRTELRKYLDKLRSQATIEWKNEELHKVYDAEVARQEAATPPVETPPAGEPAAPAPAAPPSH
jgi:parvulin-like peptidyl-prolyl isomerase